MSTELISSHQNFDYNKIVTLVGLVKVETIPPASAKKMPRAAAGDMKEAIAESLRPVLLRWQ